MRYKLGKLELYSSQSTRLLDFMSDVLELEVEVSESKVTIDGQEFIVRQSSECCGKSLDFHLDISSKEFIDEIKQKLNFFLYRKNTERSSERIISEHSRLGLNLLILSDIDGRHWSIAHRYDPYEVNF